MPAPFESLARRRAHLDADNPLRSLTEVIGKVPGGINLGQGVCDLGSPDPLVQRAVSSIAGGEDRQTYTPYAGLPELREAIAVRLREHAGHDMAPEQVVVTAGSSGAFHAAGTALLETGDEVVLFEPFYSYHHTTLRMLEAVPVCVPLRGPDLELDLDALRRAIGPRTRAIVLNTPANPSGKVFTREELVAIGEVLADTRVVVLTDEVYEYMVFDGREHVAPATVPELAGRTLTISSFSKTYSITGWRIGYVAGPRDVVEAIGRVFDQVAVCAARPMQRGVAAALRELPASYYSDLGDTYERKRNRFCAALRDAGFDVLVPQGAYYVLAGYRDLLGDIDPYSAVMRCIERIGINGVPGHLFHEDPAPVRTIRFQFAVDDPVLDDVCERLPRLRG